MAFSSRGPSERPKSLIFRTPVTQPDDYAQYRSTPLSPLRSVAANIAPQPSSSNDARNSLQRRFTTNALPSLAPIGEQRRPSNEQTEPNNAYNRMSATEKKARQYEALLAQQRRIQAQMAMIDPETRREVDEARKLEQDISLFTSGVLSEPGSPPDGQSMHVQTHVPYSNRFSTSSITSPAFNSNRQSRTGSQITSPPSEYTSSYFNNQDLPSQSVPNSQRNSDHEESDDDYNFTYATVRPKAGANPNRNSMPVTAFDLRNQNHAVSSFSPILGPVNASSFYFGDEDERKSKRSSQILTASPDSKTFLALHQTDDKFPILVRRGTDTFSGSVTPLEIPEDSDAYPRTDRNIAARHRQSLPPSAIRNSAAFADMSGLDSILSDATTAKNTAANRRSLEVKFSGLGETKRPGLLVSPQKNGLNGGPKVSSSYSTNDIPTLKSISSVNHDSKQTSAAQTPAEEIASPLQGVPVNPQVNFSKPLPPGPPQAQANTHQDTESLYRPNTSRFPAGGQQFGVNHSTSNFDAVGGAAANMPSQPYSGQSSFNNGFGMSMLTNGFSGMSIGSPPPQWPSQGPSYQSGGFNGYPSQFGAAPTGPGAGGRFGDGHGRTMQGRRGTNHDDASRLPNIKLEDLHGEIYGLCKDQHGCRFLQKKLEERNPENTRLIFEETVPHVVELMTDPFGNYLCQKLLEYCNDEQRTSLIESASKLMVKIALNQHGTRALQKMIEFITTQEQINMIIVALQNEVVQLIQDLNGNHVIQKCLNHLQQENVQFIIDAVCIHVVTVGTHRHGCCVLQRCVDHASGLQKGQLVASITRNVFALVQDPFGNYVVQYILDLGEPNFSEPLCKAMAGNVPALACQKFSSNVMEKGIRVAGEDTRRVLISEMLNPGDLQKMLRDSFANYVVQTAMDYAEEDQKAALFDTIRPILPLIRHTPHGRRIQTKISEHDGRDGNGMFPKAITGGAPSQLPSFGHGVDVMGRGQYAPTGYGMPTSAPAPYGFHNPTAHAMGNGFGYSGGQSRFPSYPNMGRAGPHNMNHF